MIETQFPLSKARRRIIFYLAALLFVVAAPLIIFYSIGYNVDIKTRQLLRTGGIFVKTNQIGFKLFINGVLARETGIISRGALVTDLKPDLYVVKVEKEGFKPWQRVIHVEAAVINEFRFITLFPEKISEKEVINLSRRGLTVDTFRALPQSPWLIIRTLEKKGLTYFFNKDTKLLDAVGVFDDFRWEPDSKRLLVKRLSPARWAVIGLAGGVVREETLRFPQGLGDIIRADFHPEIPGEFFVLRTDDILYRYNKTTRLYKPVIQDIGDFTVSSGRIFFVGRNGFFASADFDGKNTENYGRKGFFLSTNPIRAAATEAGDVFLIDSGGGFFVKRRDESEVVPSGGNIIDALFSTNGDKLLFWSERDIDIFWLKDEIAQPFRKTGTRERIIAIQDQAIRQSAWLGPDEENLIFWAGKFIGAIDIDNRGDGPQASIIFDEVRGYVDLTGQAGGLLRSDGTFIFSDSIL